MNTATGNHTPLVSGLFSVALGPEGVLGASGLSVRGGRIYAILGGTPQEGPPNIAIEQQEAGHLIAVNPNNGKFKSVASVGEADFKEGNLYLVNMFGGGAPFASFSFFHGNVVKYNAEAGKGSVLASSVDNPVLILPYMPTIGPDGNLYVTAGAICPSDGSSPFPPGAPNPCKAGGKAGGKVVEITLPHEDD